MAISLVKGQKISLSKESGGVAPQRIRVGLGWDPASEGASIDLDASALLFSDSKELKDQVYFGQENSVDRSVQHSGDNLTGEGEGDDEQIVVDLTAVDSEIKHISFVVTSYSGQTFDEIDNAFCRVVDASTGREIARYELSTSGNYKGMVIARIYRHNGDWKMAAVGEYSQEGKTYRDMLGIARSLL